MLQRSGAEVGVDDVTWLLVRLADPLGELHGVGDGSGEENVSHAVRKQDQGLLPNDTSLYEIRISVSLGRAKERHRTFVAHVMNLIEDNPCNFAHDLGTAVQH